MRRRTPTDLKPLAASLPTSETIWRANGSRLVLLPAHTVALGLTPLNSDQCHWGFKMNLHQALAGPSLWCYYTSLSSRWQTGKISEGGKGPFRGGGGRGQSAGGGGGCWRVQWTGSWEVELQRLPPLSDELFIIKNMVFTGGVKVFNESFIGSLDILLTDKQLKF